MQTEVISSQENELIQSLQTLITTYLEKNSCLTINALAQRANIPVTSLRRLANGQQKNEIAPHSVLNLTSYLIREKNLKTLVTKVDPVIGDFLQKHFGNFIFSPETKAIYECDLNNELKDQTKYFIYKLAANHVGTDWMTVVENFGTQGKKKAEEMQTKGLIIEKDGRLHATNKNFSLDLFVAAGHLPNLVGFYKPESIAEGKNSFFSLSESLTEEAIQEIRAIQRECVKKIHQVMSEEKNLGTIPYFTLNMAEIFAYESNPGELQ